MRHERFRLEVTALTIAGILIVTGVAAACGSDTASRSTVPPAPSATARAGEPQLATPTSTSSSTTTGEVLFAWNGGEASSDLRLWLVGTDGGEPRRLLADDAGLVNEVWPEWSPDGSRIAFLGMSSETHQDDLYVVDADGSNLRQLTDTPDTEQDIAWSPDGEWIAFAGVDSASFIGVVAADGSTLLRLTDAFEHAGSPAWSPDGMQIAFNGAEGGTSALYIMDDDGANLRRITDESVSGVFQPRWSPDGSRLVFTDGGYDEMFLIDADGTNLVSLAARGVWGYAPRWSPDGSAIAYVSSALGSSEVLYIVDPNGQNVRQLSGDGGRSINYDWSEDGSRIVWIAVESPADESSSPVGQLHLADRDGSNHRFLASGEASMMTPKWRPAGTTVEPQPQPTWPPDLGTPVPTRTPPPPYVPTFDTSGPPWPEPETGICEFSMPISMPDIYLMNPDGSNVREVIGRQQTYGSDAVWSPDGRSVTYFGSIPPDTVAPGVTPTADATGHVPEVSHGIFQRDIETGVDTLLVEVDGANELSWSSDGGRLAFTQSEYDGSTQRSWIAIVNADGSDQRKLTDTPEYEYDLAWSPDGEVIFRQLDGFDPGDWREDPYLLYSIRPDGTDLRALDPFERGEGQPSWSPDGRQIAFSRAGEIWVMDADGSNRRNMTQHLADDTAPAWSPDGAQILFRSLFRTPPGEIVEPLREPGQPRPITLRSGSAEQEGIHVQSCRVAGNSRSVSGTRGGVPFPTEPLLISDNGAGSATVQLDFTQFGESETLSVSVYDLAATRANGKGIGESAIILPCPAPGGVEESCRVLDAVFQPGDIVDVELALPPGDYVLIVHSNVVAGTEYGYVEQAFSIRISE